MRKFTLLICGIFFISLTSCAQYYANQAANDLKLSLDPLLGCTESELLMVFGAPCSIQDIGEIRIYKYYKNMGTVYNYYSSREVGDYIEISLLNGIVMTHKIEVRR